MIRLDPCFPCFDGRHIGCEDGEPELPAGACEEKKEK
jgi:hypothetical protein